MDRKPLLVVMFIILLLVAQYQQHLPQNRTRLSAKALVARRFSPPWVKMMNTGEDRDFVHIMGLDRPAFFTLLAPFSTAYGKYSMDGQEIESKFCSHGNRALNAAGTLGLVLHWLSSKAEEKYLCMIFAVTESTFNLYKHFGCMILLMVVSTRKDCRVIWPKHGDQEKLAQLTQEREPLLDGMWGLACFWC